MRTREKESVRCPKCGDAWKWPGTNKCYSCEEQKSYESERDRVIVNGEDSAMVISSPNAANEPCSESD